MNEQKPEAVLDDPEYYPTKDWMDREVTKPGDLNEEIFVWEISPNLQGESTYIRSYKEALDHLKLVVETAIIPANETGKAPDPEESEVTMRLVTMALGNYVAIEGE